MFKEFKEFAMGGNVIDMAVGIVIGAAFGTIVNSLVADIIMPPLGLFLGGIDFSGLFIVLKEGVTAAPYANLAAATDAGAIVMAYGQFINHVISFLVIAFSIFMVVRGINRMRKAEEKASVEPPAQEVLLAEIRDLLKKQ